MRAKRRKANIEEEQLKLLRKILAELQKLNANLAATAPKAGTQEMIEPADKEDEDSDEELEYFE